MKKLVFGSWVENEVTKENEKGIPFRKDNEEGIPLRRRKIMQEGNPLRKNCKYFLRIQKFD